MVFPSKLLDEFGETGRQAGRLEEQITFNRRKIELESARERRRERSERLITSTSPFLNGLPQFIWKLKKKNL